MDNTTSEKENVPGTRYGTTGQRIRYIRKARKLALRQVAGICKVNESTLYRWEKDELVPNEMHLDKLADVLFTTKEFLMLKTDYPLPGVTTLSGLDFTEEDLIAAHQFFQIQEPYREHLRTMISLYFDKYSEVK